MDTARRTRSKVKHSQKRMGVSIMMQMAVVVAPLGALSFIFGFCGEHEKAASGTVITAEDVGKYLSDLIPGYLCFSLLVVCTMAGFWSLLYPYRRRFIRQSGFFQHTSFVVFFNIALLLGVLAVALLSWPTITAQLHQAHNIHKILIYTCPMARTTLFHYGALMFLDLPFLWLFALMLGDCAREDFIDKVDEHRKDE